MATVDGDAAVQDSVQARKAGRPQAKRADRDRRGAHSPRCNLTRMAAFSSTACQGSRSRRQCAANAAGGEEEGGEGTRRGEARDPSEWDASAASVRGRDGARAQAAGVGGRELASACASGSGQRGRGRGRRRSS